MKKNKFNILVILLVIGSTIFSGCNMFKFKLGQIREKLKGRTSIVQTYDEESNVIDKIEGKSISISTENKFNVKDRKSTRLNSSHANISYAVFCLKKKYINQKGTDTRLICIQ